MWKFDREKDYVENSDTYIFRNTFRGICPEVDNLVFMKRTADRSFGDDCRWSVLGAGGAQMGLASAGCQMGGRVRVGLEDSRIIEDLGCEVASPDEAREILGLKGADKVAF